MSLSGTLDTMPVHELTDWMSKKKSTGILTLKRAGVTKTMTIESGQVINAASTDAREYLGQFLINFGVVTEDQLQKAFETQLETKVSGATYGLAGSEVGPWYLEITTSSYPVTFPFAPFISR